MAALASALSARTQRRRVLREQRFDLSDSEVEAVLLRACSSEGANDDLVTITAVASCSRPLRLHWATAERQGGQWLAPPPGWSTQPPRSSDGGGGAWVTEFEPVGDGCQAVDITLPTQRKTLAFLLRTDHDRFIKQDGRDMYLEFTAEGGSGDAQPGVALLEAKPPEPPPRPGGAASPGSPASPASPASRAPASLAAMSAVVSARAQGANSLHLLQAELRDKVVSGYVAHILDLGSSVRRVVLAVASSEPLRLHWGIVDRKGGTWQLPPKGWKSSSSHESSQRGDSAMLTRFENGGVDGIQVLELTLLDVDKHQLAFLFVTDQDRYVKRYGQDVLVPLFAGAADDSVGKAKKGSEGGEAQENGHNHHAFSPRQRKHSERPAPEGAGAPPASATAAAKAPPPERVARKDWPLDELLCDLGAIGGDGAFDHGLADRVSHGEGECQRSLMHRFNFAADLVGQAAEAGQSGLVVLFTWFRFMAMRQLVINRNYNIKPREIGAAQEKVTLRLAGVYGSRRDLREITRLTMATIGSGGSGNIGQRIRDEILDVQKRNDCKGGMMEEWHQKLHNNTCPDDVVICEALLAYIEGDLDISLYWARLANDRVTKERLASYDKKITSEPRFRKEQCTGLQRDLKEYLKTLKAVHSGADLDSAANAVLGYSQGSCQGKEVQVSPVSRVATPRLRSLVDAAQQGAAHARAADDPLLVLEPMVEARWELRPWTAGGGADVGDRLKDVIYLDLALEAAIRTTIEGCLARMSSYRPTSAMQVVGLALESLTMSTDCNGELLICLKQWRQSTSAAWANQASWALAAKAAMDRIGRELAAQSERMTRAVSPPAEGLGGRLRVDGNVIKVYAEEVVRGGSAAPLSQLLRALDPMLRKLANLGAWQIISPVPARGRLVCVDSLASVQLSTYSEATVLVTGNVGGDEEIPEGVVALLTTDMPDILSHVAVRARNEKCFFATILDAAVFDGVSALQGAVVACSPSPAGDSATVERVAGGQQSSVPASPSQAAKGQPADDVQGIAIKPVSFAGRFAVVSSEFDFSIVGGKSCNLNSLRGRLPEWIQLPASAALPYGTFDMVLKAADNKAVSQQLLALVAEVETSGASFGDKLAAIRKVLQNLKPTPEVVLALQKAFDREGLPWPGEPGKSAAGSAAWSAIVGVWASKWNDRAYLSCRKSGLDHSAISMAVLCQQVVQARYAFVIHTTNPSTGDDKELYAEVVCGLGETLVGNYAGRALSFSAPKSDLSQLAVRSFPSKSVGLFVDAPTMIFRSDSNAEDLEGFAGAGLYDSIIMGDGAVERSVDYSGEPLVCDAAFQAELLRKIAEVGCCIERALGSAQDIEGAVDAENRIFVVQTRPQV